MKKLISMILALAMIFSLSITAMADEQVHDSIGNSSTINVGATYKTEAAQAPAIVYYVKIEWTATNTLTYIDNGVAYVWDAMNTKYVEAEENQQVADKWDGEAQYTITATNHSNAVVNANVAVEANDGFEITNAFADGKSAMELANAAENVEIAEGNQGAPKSDNVTVSVEVTSGTIAADSNVAKITITLSAPVEGE